MAQDLEETRAAAHAPAPWPEIMIQPALDAGLVVDTPAGPDVTLAIQRVVARVAAWADDRSLAGELERLMVDAKIMFDPPLIRAALAAGAELAMSAALIRWPTSRADELEALARAQTLLAAGAKL